jgi:hypothetical protein
VIGMPTSDRSMPVDRANSFARSRSDELNRRSVFYCAEQLFLKYPARGRQW